MTPPLRARPSQTKLITWILNQFRIPVHLVTFNRPEVHLIDPPACFVRRIVFNRVRIIINRLAEPVRYQRGLSGLQYGVNMYTLDTASERGGCNHPASCIMVPVFLIRQLDPPLVAITISQGRSTFGNGRHPRAEADLVEPQLRFS